MRSVLAIAGAELRRFMADRSNIFFVLIFPLALVFVIGSQFGGGGAGSVALAGSDSALRTALVQELEAHGVEVALDDEDGMRQQVARGSVYVGVVVPAEAAEAFGSGAGGSDGLRLEMVTGPQSSSPAVAQVARTAADAVTLRAGQEAALVAAGADQQDVGAALDRAETDVAPATAVTEDTSGLAEAFSGLGQFDLGASSQVLLFTFLTTLSGAAPLIGARRDGVIRRIMAAPVTSGQAVLGLALGRLVIAIFQGLYIVLATRLVFGVDWGDLSAVLVLLVTFGLVAAGVAMVIGVLVDNEGLATGLAVGGGLILAAIGGSMVPLEIFPERLQRIAHLTPHAWGYDAMAEIQRRGGGVLDILPELGVLAAMAVLTLVLGSWLLRRSLARAM